MNKEVLKLDLLQNDNQSLECYL